MILTETSLEENLEGYILLFLVLQHQNSLSLFLPPYFVYSILEDIHTT